MMRIVKNPRPSLMLVIEIGGHAIPLARVTSDVMVDAALENAIASRKVRASGAPPAIARKLGREAAELEEFIRPIGALETVHV